MRLKEFIYFMIIFTIAYTIFWIIIDFLIKIRDNQQKKQHIARILSPDMLNPFLYFYGIQTTYTKELLMSIYQEVLSLNEFKISQYSNKYQITPYEFVVIILYLEYNNLITKKKVYFQEDYIKSSDYKDQNLLYKYGNLFLNKYTLQQIVTTTGNVAYNDLVEIDKYFLYPGVRFINSNIYYLGGQNEKK